MAGSTVLFPKLTSTAQDSVAFFLHADPSTPLLLSDGRIATPADLVATLHKSVKPLLTHATLHQNRVDSTVSGKNSFETPTPSILVKQDLVASLDAASDALDKSRIAYRNVTSFDINSLKGRAFPVVLQEFPEYKQVLQKLYTTISTVGVNFANIDALTAEVRSAVPEVTVLSTAEALRDRAIQFSQTVVNWLNQQLQGWRKEQPISASLPEEEIISAPASVPSTNILHSITTTTNAFKDAKAAFATAAVSPATDDNSLIIARPISHVDALKERDTATSKVAASAA